MGKKIILFDIGNVFLKPIHGEIINTIYKNRNCIIDNEEYTNKVKLILNDSFEGKINLQQTWDKLFDLVNIHQIEKRNFIENSFNITRNEKLINYVIDTLSQKYNIGIISDLSQIGYFVFNKYYKDLYDICDKDKIFISVETKKTKSKNGKMYFDEIVDKLGVNPNEIIFIDDEIHNIESANKSKMNTILFESRKYTWDVANDKMKKMLKKLDNIVLKEIDFHITNRCNMNCIHCLYDSGKKYMDEMKLDDIKKVIKEFSTISNRGGSINLFGGEIFVRKDIFNIIETVKKENLKLGIITNGYFNETIFNKIVECKPERLTIDLDGASAETHDWLRNKKGSFEKSVANIRKFIENKINISITTVLNKKNVNEIENILELCRILDIYSISFFMMTPLGRGENLKEYVLDGNEWIETKNKVQSWVESNKPKFSIIWENAFIEKYKLVSQKILCNDFCGEVLNIKCNGDVYFCGLLTSQDKGKIGNIKYESLKDIIKKANTKTLNMKGCFALKLDESRNKEVISCNAITGCPYNIEQLNKYMEVK